MCSTYWVDSTPAPHPSQSTAPSRCMRRREPIPVAMTACVHRTAARRSAMRDVTAELKELRLHGMAAAWTDLVEQGSLASLESSRWLIEHLLQAESTNRALRSVSYQMSAA